MKTPASSIVTCGALALAATSCQAFTSSRHHLPPAGAATTALHASSTNTDTAARSTSTTSSSPLDSFDVHAGERLPWFESGYSTWEWKGRAGDKGHAINYLELGDPSKPSLLLIHGFGASAYHFRHNIPELARDYHVYAFDLLGFGLSDKPLEDYSAEVWRDQALDFIEEVIGKPTIVAGNSLGGFTSLYAAAHSGADGRQDLVRGCVLLNAAGRFRDPDSASSDESVKKNAVVETIKEWISRAVIQASFLYTKQPARIEQVLRQVYPVSDANVDAELVESIRVPSLDPNAAEVFYRVITKNGSGPAVYVDDLLARLQDMPLLLAWGESDPWIRPQAADRIQALYPQSRRVSIDAGHCPHDEDPLAVNKAILDFAKEIHGL